ncbi:hypothetical protein [Hyphomonas sp.]|uniref:hypothetical protein n=1 Tax=Hyphomonas sp. TaxID=87 RepID=UPI00391A52A9
MKTDPDTEKLKADWNSYACGAHFPADTQADAHAPVAGDIHPLIAALMVLELRGEPAARERLQAEKSDDPGLAYWKAVELAGLADGAGQPGPGKWALRTDQLEQVGNKKPGSADGGSGAGWIISMAEGRRQLMLAEAMNRDDRPFSESQSFLTRASASFAAAGDSYGIARARVLEARALSWRGRLVEAQHALSAAFVRFAALGNRFGIADSSYELGVALRELHRFEEAAEMLGAAIGIFAQTGRPDTLARAEQGLALCLIAQIRYGDRRGSLVDEAFRYAATAFVRSTCYPDQPWPETVAVSVTAEQTRRDGFRAAMAARDLSELSLLTGEVQKAQAWRNRAMTESGLSPENGETLKGRFVMPSFDAATEPDGDRMHALAQKAGSFTAVRLAEIDEYLIGPRNDDETPGLAQIAAAWRMRGTPSFEIEAWLAAADQASTSPSVPARLRFEALRRAEQLGSAVFRSYLPEIPGEIPKADRSAADAAGVRVAQILRQDTERVIYRVIAKDSVTSGRLLVHRGGANNGRTIDRVPDLASLSRRRQGFPRISAWGYTDGNFWLLDELTTGQPLRNALEHAASPAVRARILASLLLAESALQKMELEAAALRLESVVVLPGDTPVAREYAPLFCSRNETGNAIFAGATRDASLLETYGALIHTTLSGDRSENRSVSPLLSEIGLMVKRAKRVGESETLTRMANLLHSLSRAE